jgi:hypothetical protein
VVSDGQPHECKVTALIRYIIFLAADVNAMRCMGSLAAFPKVCVGTLVRCAGPTVARACQPAHHVSPQLNHCTPDALALLAMRRRTSVSQWLFRVSQSTTCLECLTVMEELRVPRQQQVTTRVYSGEACNAQQA